MVKRTKKGGIQIFPVFILLLILIGIVSLFLYENIIANNKYSNFKNGLDATNLAIAKNIDQKQLARTGELTFKEHNLPGAFETFKSYLSQNYNLDSNLKSRENNKAIVGNVEILDLRLYSVQDNKVTEWRYVPSVASFIKASDNSINVITPNKKPVQETSVYSEIKLTTYTVTKTNETQTKDLTIESYVDFIKKEGAANEK